MADPEAQLRALAAECGERKLRVLQMCAVDFTVRQFLLPLTRALMQSGYDVTIACSRGPYFDEIRSMGFDIRENPVARSMNVLSHLRSLWRTYRLMRQEKFDIVHVHTPIAALIGRLAARLARIPVKIYTAHGFYFHEHMSAPKREIHVALERLGARCGDFIMTVSKEDEEAAVRLGIESAERVETVYNGVDTDHFDPARLTNWDRYEIRQELGIPAESLVVGIVGRLVREKGVFELFEAARSVLEKHPKTRFLIVGDTLPSDRDGSKAEIKTRVQQLGIEDKLVFTGLVRDTSRYLSVMDVFCLPSYREGMPVSVLEAMAMQLPVVATNIRGCREEVENGQTGWLIPPRDSKRLAEKITWLLDDPERAHEMGVRGRERVRHHFNLNCVLQHEVAIYKRLTAYLRDV